MKMTEFFNFLNGFGFSIFFSIFGWANGQLWKKIRFFGIFPALFQIFGVKMAQSSVYGFGFGFSDFF